MVQIDIPAAFIASQLFLDLGKKSIKRQAEISKDTKPQIYYKFLSRSVFFAGAVIAPAGIYLLAGWPGWEQIYWTESVEKVINSWTNALEPAFFVMFIVLAAYIGHDIGYKWITSGKERYLRPTYVGLLAAVTIIVLYNYPAFLYIGTYAQYHSPARSSMPYAWDNPYGFGIGWLLVMTYFALALAYMVRLILRENRDN